MSGFEKRLAAAGISRQRLDQLVCPIGIAGIHSKAPAVIAAATAAQLLERDEALKTAVDQDVTALRRAGRQVG